MSALSSIRRNIIANGHGGLKLLPARTTFNCEICARVTRYDRSRKSLCPQCDAHITSNLTSDLPSLFALRQLQDHLQ